MRGWIWDSSSPVTSTNFTEPSTLTGLSHEEAAAKLRQFGYNELPSAKPRNLLQIAGGVLREPMLLLLAGAAAVYVMLGSLKDALVLGAFVFVVAGINLYQERKTERALDALRDLSSPRALVIRGGERMRIAGRDVVPGDLLILAEGDRVPADAVLVSATNLATDESLLTGESVPVRKIAEQAAQSGATGQPMGDPDRVSAHTIAPRPGGDDLPYVFSGTLVVRGHGIARAEATGARTELGKIGKSLAGVEAEPTRLQTEARRIVFLSAIAAAALCVIIAVAYGLTRGDWLRGFLAALSTAMATLPEEIPVVLSVFLALGAWRLSRLNVLTRRAAAIETLGATTVLCVDKTGTLTMNRMALRELYAGGQSLRLAVACGGDAISDDAAGSAIGGGRIPGAFEDLIEAAALATRSESIDPMDIAIRKIAEARLRGAAKISGGGPRGRPQRALRLVREYPLKPALLAITEVWEAAEDRELVIAAKGAPEAIADLCHSQQAERDEISEEVARMAAQGLRVLGVAKARYRRPDADEDASAGAGRPAGHADRSASGATPAEPSRGAAGLPASETVRLPDNPDEFPFEFVGLVGLADPVRPAVPEAVQECVTAGIRIVMITGDYPGTAVSIAREVGLKSSSGVITGPELASMSDAQLRDRIGSVDIFARAAPDQKLRLVKALKAAREVVAMTGDGVNDAPALKSASIGIAMGQRGTDVAREAADLVLLDDDFSSIVHAVRMGRRVYDNLKKALAYTLAIHVPIAGLSLVPVLLKWPLILEPVHIAFLELIIDPSCSIAFEAEPEEANIMRRPPRAIAERLFDRQMLGVAFLQGAGVLMMLLVVFAVALYRGQGETDARTLTFTALVLANLALIQANRSWRGTFLSSLRARNMAAVWIAAGALAVLGAVLYVPSLRALFDFSILHWNDLALCAGAGLGSLAWFEILKAVRRRLTAEHAPKG
jgi:Ca2+-transporting ATPase